MVIRDPVPVVAAPVPARAQPQNSQAGAPPILPQRPQRNQLQEGASPPPAPGIVANPGAFPQGAMTANRPLNGQQLYGINTPPGTPYFRPPPPNANFGIYGPGPLAARDPYTAAPVRQNAYEQPGSGLN